MRPPTETIFTEFSGVPPQPVNNGTQFHNMTIPAPSVTVFKSIGYEFRVVEYVDDKDNIVKVGLQSKSTEYSRYGQSVDYGWKDVPRIRLPLSEFAV
jgi:hypothetical protein